jgi:hypothetical protein
MKKIGFVLSLAIALAISFSVLAQSQLQQGEDGTFRLKHKEQCFKDVNITATKDAEQYIEFFPQAVAHPGDTIPLGAEIKSAIKMNSLFYGLQEIRSGEGIICNNNLISCTGGCIIKMEEVFCPIIILAIISLLLMVLSNITLNKKAPGSALVSAFAAFIIVTTFVFSLNALAALIFAFLSAITILIALYALAFGKEKGRKVYKLASIIYYILMTVTIVLYGYV